MAPRICSFCGTEMKEIEQAGYIVDVCPQCTLGESAYVGELPRDFFRILAIALCIAFIAGMVLVAGLE